MIGSIGKQSGESMQSVLNKKRKAIQWELSFNFLKKAKTCKKQFSTFMLYFESNRGRQV